MRHHLLVASGERPKRLDHYLTGHLRDLSRTQLQRLIVLGRVRVHGRQAKPSQRVHGGDRIEFDSPPPAPLHASQKLTVWSEDEDVLVVDKPAGVVMHPGSGHWADTLVNAVLHHIGASEAKEVRPRLVHRLDKATSGLVLIAKTVQAQQSLSRQFAEHRIARRYIALVRGAPALDQDLIDLAIGRARQGRAIVSAETSRPKRAVTHYQILERYGDLAARLLLIPRTGRTHQLRVHLQAIGHPILGDHTYDRPAADRLGPILIHRMMLHAEMIGYWHPRTGLYREHVAPIPPDVMVLHEVLKSGDNTSGMEEST